ncbi:MAG: hypothetical protein BVN34_02855 [Proteobacteria bacterium ST_bin12]|nr:MAG: hypothetical protein BVN34_02855 [Proteobacteria bacterium ST_bin12]
MRQLLILFILMLSCEAQAEIFVCKDSSNKLTYQDEPCLNQTVRKLKNIPDAPIEDQILARERIDRANALSAQRAATVELERQQKQKEFAELQAIAIEKRKLELLEQQANESQQATIPQWILGSRYGYPIGYTRPYAYRDGRKPDFNRPRTNRQRNNQTRNNRPINNQR